MERDERSRGLLIRIVHAPCLAGTTVDHVQAAWGGSPGKTSTGMVTTS